MTEYEADINPQALWQRILSAEVITRDEERQYIQEVNWKALSEVGKNLDTLKELGQDVTARRHDVRFTGIGQAVDLLISLDMGPLRFTNDCTPTRTKLKRCGLPGPKDVDPQHIRDGLLALHDYWPGNFISFATKIVVASESDGTFSIGDNGDRRVYDKSASLLLHREILAEVLKYVQHRDPAHPYRKRSIALC